MPNYRLLHDVHPLSVLPEAVGISVEITYDKPIMLANVHSNIPRALESSTTWQQTRTSR